MLLKMENSKSNLCNECPSTIRGLCCYKKRLAQINKFHWTLVYYDPCKYLNKKTGRCKVYEKRREYQGPKCLTIEEALDKPFTLPYGCAYLHGKTISKK